MHPTDIARVTHEANRALQMIQALPGIPVAAPWDDFPEQEGVIAGVRDALDGATPEELHDSWIATKYTEGWVYGTVKDPEKKTHPCLVPYEELPADQRIKDHLFAGIVKALA